MSDQSRSVRENVAWIESRARDTLARDHVHAHPDTAVQTLAEIAERAAEAYAALDVADKQLNDWSAMTGLPAGP